MILLTFYALQWVGHGQYLSESKHFLYFIYGSLQTARVPFSLFSSMFKLFLKYVFNLKLFYKYLEPIASTKPKVDQHNKFNGEVANVGETFRLNCIGQAYPKPVYK